MLYELAGEPPPPESLLESVFLLTAKRRQEADYYKTHSMIAGFLATQGGDVKVLEEALQEYRNSVFPFMQAAKVKELEDTKKTLKKWTQDITAMKIRPLWRAHDHKALVSKLRRGKEKVIQLEEERRKRRHRRI
jgi:hypothetical protein